MWATVQVIKFASAVVIAEQPKYWLGSSCQGVRSTSYSLLLFCVLRVTPITQSVNLMSTMTKLKSRPVAKEVVSLFWRIAYASPTTHGVNTAVASVRQMFAAVGFINDEIIDCVCRDIQGKAICSCEQCETVAFLPVVSVVVIE